MRFLKAFSYKFNIVPNIHFEHIECRNYAQSITSQNYLMYTLLQLNRYTTNAIIEPLITSKILLQNTIQLGNASFVGKIRIEGLPEINY